MNSAFLSIMLPTYNRFDKLERSLGLLKETCKDEIHSEKVDFCIIDNASSDETPRVIDSFEGDLELRRIRNPENIGGNNNILKCMVESRGEYTWIIGDDDIVLPGSIRAIVHALQETPDCEFVGLPLGLIDEKDVAEIVARGSAYEDCLRDRIRFAERELPQFLEFAQRNDYRLDWADLIDPDFSSVFLGAMMASVFRTAPCAREAREAFIDLRRRPFDALDNTYPHSMVLGKCFVGKRARVLPRMALAAIVWEREWSPYRPLIVTRRLHDLLDYYSGLGVSPAKIEKCRRALLSQYRGIFWKIAFEKSPLYRQDFSLVHQLRAYWRFGEFWTGIAPRIRRMASKLIRRLIKQVQKAA